MKAICVITLVNALITLLFWWFAYPRGSKPPSDPALCPFCSHPAHTDLVCGVRLDDKTCLCIRMDNPKKSGDLFKRRNRPS